MNKEHLKNQLLKAVVEQMLVCVTVSHSYVTAWISDQEGDDLLLDPMSTLCVIADHRLFHSESIRQR